MLAAADGQVAQVFTLDDVTRFIGQFLAGMRAAGFDSHELFGMRLAIGEALVNSIRHGHHGDTTKAVEIRFRLDERQVMIEIRDQGGGFDPDGVPDPRAPRHLERVGGRGVFLMRHYMTWVQFNDKGNCVTLCKVKSK